MPTIDSMTPALSITGLQVNYGSVQVIDGLDLDVQPGEMLALLGPSGSGKTTILRAVAGILSAAGGSVELGGTEVSGLPTRLRSVGVMFQSYALFPHMTVAENIEFGLRVRKDPKEARKVAVEDIVRFARLEGLEDRFPAALSGGQQQRVALARSLVVGPKLLLLDEPFSNLDAKVREEMRLEMSDIIRRAEITTVLVTHDQADAATLADRVAVLEGGKLQQVAPYSELYESPATRFVADFIGESNVVRGTATSVHSEQVTVQIGGQRWTARRAGPVREGDSVDVVIRRASVREVMPEESISGDQNVLCGRLIRTVRVDHATQVWISHEGQDMPFLVQSEMPADATSGDTLTLRLDPGMCHAFPPADA